MAFLAEGWELGQVRCECGYVWDSEVCTDILLVHGVEILPYLCADDFECPNCGGMGTGTLVKPYAGRQCDVRTS